MRIRRLFLGAWLGLAVALATACSGAHEPAAEHAGATAIRPAARPVLNVPALMGASIDELQQQLGPLQPLPPQLANLTTLLALRPGAAFDGVGTFARPPLLLQATFNTCTREVSDLLVLGHNEQLLLQQAQLAVTAPTYLVLPVFTSGDNAQLLGLRVIAKPLVQ